MGDSDSSVICTIRVCNRADPETGMSVMSDSDSPVICTIVGMIHVCNSVTGLIQKLVCL